MITFILYTIFVGASIGGLPIQYAQIQKAIGSTERVFDIIDETPENLRERKSELNLKGDLRFDNVSFTYPSRKDMTVLDKVSFQVDQSQTLAIAGPSGAGKSTIASLILRFSRSG